VISAVVMLAMSSAVDEAVSDDEIVEAIRARLRVILPD